MAVAVQPCAPHLALTGLLGARVLLQLLSAGKKALALVRKSPCGAGVGELGAVWAPMGEPTEWAVSLGEVLTPFRGFRANSCACQCPDAKMAAFGFEPGC